MTKKQIKEEDFIEGVIESVAKQSEKVWKKSTEKKSSPHMSVDQIADRADKEVMENKYLKKVMSGKGLKGGGIAAGMRRFNRGGKV